MNTRIVLNSGKANYLLISLGLVWISLIIRWGMLRIASVAAICTLILLSGLLKIGATKGVNYGLGNSNT